MSKPPSSATVLSAFAQGTDMAPMKPVEENDVFSNRRMTRSAFKHASGYLEKMSQQKELVFPIQKQDGLLEKKLSLSKADDKQQEEQQQQQYRDGEDMEEVRRKNREFRIERNKAFLRRRTLTREEAESYSKTVTESEGFDVVDLPKDILDFTGLIRRVQQSNETDRILAESAKSAIATFNKVQKSKYRFVKLIKANYYPASGICYYITFEAEDEDIGSKKFQAFVRVHFGKTYVNFCRIEEPSKEWVQSNCKYLMRDVDPNEPREPPPALFWEDFRKAYLEKYPNATDNDVAKAVAGKWIPMSGAEKARYIKIAKGKLVQYRKDLKAYKKHKKELADGQVEEEKSDLLRSKVNDEDEDEDDGKVVAWKNK